MRILIVGDGYLGNRMKRECFPTATIYQGERLATDIGKVAENYDCIINAAAKTNIDWCEKNKVECYLSNVQLAADLADLCQQQGKRYVFISSGCIFESLSDTDWKDESSYPNPGCYYGLTKWMAEELVLGLNPFSLIVRIRLPLSSMPGPRNTITKILSYPYLNNSQESVTVIEDMLPVFKEMVLNNTRHGVFHLINAGTISPAEIGRAFGHKFAETTKEEQDQTMKWGGRARRVSTHLHSTKVPELPDIRATLPLLVDIYKENLLP